MVRLFLGCALLAPTLVTGILAGTTGEMRARSVITVRTEEQIVYRIAGVIQNVDPHHERITEEDVLILNREFVDGELRDFLDSDASLIEQVLEHWLAGEVQV